MIERLYANERYADALAGLTDYTGGGIFDEGQMLYWVGPVSEEEGHAATDPTVGVRQRPAGLPLRRPAVAGCERRPQPGRGQ